MITGEAGSMSRRSEPQELVRRIVPAPSSASVSIGTRIAAGIAVLVIMGPALKIATRRPASRPRTSRPAWPDDAARREPRQVGIGDRDGILGGLRERAEPGAEDQRRARQLPASTPRGRPRRQPARSRRYRDARDRARTASGFLPRDDRPSPGAVKGGSAGPTCASARAFGSNFAVLRGCGNQCDGLCSQGFDADEGQ